MHVFGDPDTVLHGLRTASLHFILKTKAMNIKQELYEHIAHIGETKPTIKGKIHIVDVTNDRLPIEIGSFKVYHSDGYCFNTYCDTDEDGIYYGFYSEYEGFKKCDPETALQLIKDFDNGL